MSSSNEHIQKVVKIFSEIRDERYSGRHVVTIDSFKGGVTKIDVGKGIRVPEGGCILSTKTGSFVVVPVEEE